MHDHDQDLIAALADGSLDDETEARALIESCDECLADYQDQVEVLSLLATTPTAHLTDTERAALHRDLWAELHKPSVTRSFSPLWLRWSYVAAGVFVSIGLVSVLSGLGLFGGDAASTQEGEVFSEIGSGLADSGGGGEEAPRYDLDSTGQDAESASETTTAAADESILPYPFDQLANEARSMRAATGDDAGRELSLPPEAEECLETIGLSEQRVIEVLDLDQSYLVVMPEDETEDPPVSFVAVDRCELVYVDR